MNNEPQAGMSWNTALGKMAIYKAVMDYLHKNPDERTRCLDYACGREIVMKVTGMAIPPDARVLFLPEKDNLRGDPPPFQPKGLGGIPYNAGSSMIVTLPPEADYGDEDKVLLYACSYIIWGTKSPPPGEPRSEE